MRGDQTYNVEIDNLIDDPFGATVEDLLHTVNVVTRRGTEPHIKANPGTVSTFYSATGDGFIESTTTSWAGVLSGTNLAADTTAAYLGIASIRFNPNRWGYESFAAWDTSAITDTDTIDSATLSLYNTGKGGTGTIRAYSLTWGTLTTADWQDNTELAALTELATISIASVTTSAYNDLTNTGTNLAAAINKTGTTEMCFAEARIEDNSEPANSTDNFTDMSSADVAGTTQDPKLVVTHSAAGGTTVTPTTASLTTTKFAPTVSTPRLVTPSTLALTTAKFAPTVLTPRLCTPSTASLTTTKFAPTVSAPRLVTPSTASLTLATFAPTVSLAKLVVPSTASLTLSTFAPTVTSTGDDLLLTPDTKALTLTTFAPTVATPRLVTPGIAELTTTKFAPTVTTPRLVTPGTASLTTTGYAPTVATSGMTVTPSTATLSLTAYAPTVTGSGIAIYCYLRVA